MISVVVKGVYYYDNVETLNEYVIKTLGGSQMLNLLFYVVKIIKRSGWKKNSLFIKGLFDFKFWVTLTATRFYGEPGH